MTERNELPATRHSRKQINMSRNIMKHLFTSPDSAQVGLARSILEAARIPCEVRNEAVSQALPILPCASEIWVRDEDYDEAHRLLTETAREDTSAST
jgi:hypothetical protein